MSKKVILTGGTGYLDLTQVKRNRKALHMKYRPLGPFVQNLMDAYNDNIVSGVVQFWLATAKSCEFVIAQSEDKKLSTTEIKKNIVDLENAMLDNTVIEFINKIYTQYRKDIQSVSKQTEIDNVGQWSGSEETIKLATKICNDINSLRRYYSMKSVEDLDDIEQALEIVFSRV